MKWLFLLILIALIVGAVIWYRDTQAAKKQREEHRRGGEDVIASTNKAETDDLRMLTLGDIVDHHGQQWHVRGRIDFNESGYTWTEYLLDDAHTKRWLCIEEDESFEVSMWHTIPEADIESGRAGDRNVIVAGTHYRLDEQGTAHFTATGATGTAPSGSCSYADYEAASGKLLGFENFGGSWEPALGERVQPWELTVYPATDRPGPR